MDVLQVTAKRTNIPGMKQYRPRRPNPYQGFRGRAPYAPPFAYAPFGYGYVIFICFLSMGISSWTTKTSTHARNEGRSGLIYLGCRKLVPHSKFSIFAVNSGHVTLIIFLLQKSSKV